MLFFFKREYFHLIYQDNNIHCKPRSNSSLLFGNLLRARLKQLGELILRHCCCIPKPEKSSSLLPAPFFLYLVLLVAWLAHSLLNETYLLLALKPYQTASSNYVTSRSARAQRLANGEIVPWGQRIQALYTSAPKTSVAAEIWKQTSSIARHKLHWYNNWWSGWAAEDARRDNRYKHVCESHTRLPSILQWLSHRTQLSKLEG